MKTSSALYVGHVMHRRLRPCNHRLDYSMLSLLLDLDEIEALDARLRLFSRNAFNLYSFRDRDHGNGSAEPLRAQIEQLCDRAGIRLDGGPIRLLTMPRILGFVFNPLSVFFCHDRGGRLRATLYEVNNTFGERHSYLLPVEQSTGPVRQHCEKRFHVSPFMPMDLRYAFRVAPSDDRLAIAITVSDAKGRVLTAVHSARRQPLTDGTLARALITHPLLTGKVVGAILWEALKLWVKRVPVHRHPLPPDDAVTIIPTGGKTACT